MITIGSSRILISPTLPVALAGRGGERRLSEKLAGDLEANVLVARDSKSFIALISIDTLFCAAAFKDSVIRDFAVLTGQRLQSVFLIATHTHHAPSLDPYKVNLGEVDPEYFATTSRNVAAGIRDALNIMSPGLRVERSSTQLTANSRRRTKTLRLSRHWPWVSYAVCLAPQRDATVPSKLDMIVLRSSSGEICACLWSWACHATTFPHPRVVSADFPGEMRVALRRLFKSPGLPVVFLPGFAGDLACDVARSPVSLARRMMTPFARPFAEATADNFKLLSDRLANAAESCLERLSPQSQNELIHSNSLKLPLSHLMKDEKGEAAIEISRLILGPLDFVLIGAEVCSPWAEIIQPFVGEDAVLSGYCNDVPCYLPTGEQVLEGGYEAEGFRPSFSLAGTFAENMQASVLAAIRELVSRLPE